MKVHILFFNFRTNSKIEISHSKVREHISTQFTSGVKIFDCQPAATEKYPKPQHPFFSKPIAFLENKENQLIYQHFKIFKGRIIYELLKILVASGSPRPITTNKKQQQTS